MTSVFDIYYQTVKQKLPQINDISQVNELEKMLKQMDFQISLSSLYERHILQKKYNECANELKEFKSKTSLGLIDTTLHIDSSLLIKESQQMENTELLTVNSGKKLMMISQLTNEIEANGRNIAIQLDDNRNKFNIVINKVKGMNAILNDSKKLIMSWDKNWNRIAIGGMIMIGIMILIIVYIMKR